MDPYIFYTLPPPLILPPSQLILIYFGVFCLDYVSLRHPRTVPCVILYHIILPVFLVSPWKPLNVLFTGVPIYTASFTGQLDRDTLVDPMRWIKALATDIVETESRGHIRLLGVTKICRGVFKVSLIATLLDQIWHQLGMSPWTSETLSRPWYDPQSLLYNFLQGVTVYCLLGVADIFMGIEQAVTGHSFMDMFDSPFLASSPRDFWSRRWNRVVHREFHHQLFLPGDEKTKTKKAAGGFWDSKNGRGLIVFMTSGFLHELILWSNCRDITLENFAFFTLHGLAVMVETNLTRNQRRQSLVELWLCRFAFMLFISFSARLFIAPFVRHNFWEPLS